MIEQIGIVQLRPIQRPAGVAVDTPETFGAALEHLALSLETMSDARPRGLYRTMWTAQGIGTVIERLRDLARTARAQQSLRCPDCGNTGFMDCPDPVHGDRDEIVDLGPSAAADMAAYRERVDACETCHGMGAVACRCMRRP